MNFVEGLLWAIILHINFCLSNRKFAVNKSPKSPKWRRRGIARDTITRVRFSNCSTKVDPIYY
jgi:hypothetical protein